MKIACLQLDSVLRQVEKNIEKADSILAASSASLGTLDLLVLPELAFTGYNYPTAESIRPYLEPTTAGPSTRWAIDTARRLQCHVVVGYPEVSTELDEHGEAINYNSTVTVGPDGTVLATYRKSHLYYTDEIWAAEGGGFYCGTLGSLGTVSHGICMDMNPYQFMSPWDAYEFANHSVQSKAPLIVLSTAWLTSANLHDLQAEPEEPDFETLSYWYSRMMPLTKLTNGESITIVFANRTGTEQNDNHAILTRRGHVIDFGESVTYAGSSCVMQITGGQAYMFDVLGSHTEGLLVVDTTKRPKYALQQRLLLETMMQAHGSREVLDGELETLDSKTNTT